MKRAIRLVTIGTLAAAVLVGAASVAGASPGVTTCNGELAAGTYKRVVVPADAVCLSNGPVTVRGGLYIEQGATFVLGSEENPVDTGTINGGIDVHGGSGPFGGPFDVTWNTIEDSSIHGNVTISGYNGFWMGFIRNDVHGSVNLTDNILVDEDGNEYVTNTIHGSLRCSGNSPAPQVGDSEGELNVVTGAKTGQCAGL